MKLSEKEESPYTRALVYGMSGVGKTTLVSKLARNPNRRLIWCSLDNDVDVLRKLTPEEQDRVDLIDLPDTASYPIAAQTLMQLFKLQTGKICHAHGVWACAVCIKNKAPFTSVDFTKLDSRHVVVIDTGSQLGRSILAHVIKNQPVDYKPERDDWGALRKFTEFFASQFQGARFNLIVICHAIDAELKDKSTKLIPDFGSKPMAMTFGKAFSHVIYMSVLNKKHRAFSKSTHADNIFTKSRTDFAIEELAEPSLETLFPISESDLAKGYIVSEAQAPEPAAVSQVSTVLPAGNVVAPTPAQTAASSLTALQERMKAKGLVK